MLISGNYAWLAWPLVAAAVLAFQLKAHRGLWHTLGALLLATHLVWMASVGFFPMPIGEGQGFSLRSVNLVPFRDLVDSFEHLGTRQLVRQHGGNFLLFVPFTLVGSALWPRLRAWKWALAIGLGGSMAVELLQLVADAAVGAAYRSVDIDDVMVNTIGALFGYGLFLGVRRARHCGSA